MVFLAIDRQSPGGGRKELLSDIAKVLGIAELLDEHRKFISPDTGQSVRCAHAFEQMFRNLAKDIVTRTVPQRVIDDLEAIEVEKQHAHRASGSLCASQRSGQVIIEKQAIRQPGQIIMMCQVPDSIGGPAALNGDAGEVRANADQMGVQPVRVLAPAAVNRQGTQDLTRAPEYGPGADRMQTGLAHKVAQGRIEWITGEILDHYGRAVAN